MDRKPRVLLVTVESPWPERHGGRIRTAGVASTLATRFDVLVAFPAHGVMGDAPVNTRRLSWRAPSPLRTRLHPGPHLGRYWIRPLAAELVDLARTWQPDVIYWSHSYLAAAGPRGLARLEVVEFANLEHDRLLSLQKAEGATHISRTARRVEAWKSRSWEPQVARRSDLSVALCEPDGAWLRKLAGSTIVVENGVSARAYMESPQDGPVLFAASFDYAPNRSAIIRFMREVWPRVTHERPQTVLRLVGTGSENLPAECAFDGVEVIGPVDDISQHYQECAMVLAPVVIGGGRQLKITEALAWGRMVVASPYSALSAPSDALESRSVVVADDPEMAAVLVKSLNDVEQRHEAERLGWNAIRQRTWTITGAELLDRLDSMLLSTPGGDRREDRLR